MIEVPRDPNMVPLLWDVNPHDQLHRPLCHLKQLHCMHFGSTSTDENPIPAGAGDADQGSASSIYVHYWSGPISLHYHGTQSWWEYGGR